MRTLVLVSFAVVSLSACQDQKPAASGAPTAPAAAVKATRAVLGAEAKAAVANGATLLDVRTVDEFEELHLPGAVNIPLDQLFDRLSAVPKAKPVVIYCASGARSSVAAGVLAKAGYEVMDLGGLGNWNR